MMSTPWRAVIDKPRSASLNMALDYLMLQAVARNESAPVIRIYQWEQPAITIGYFQIIHEEVYEDECTAGGVPVIRRISGGGAVLHEHDITYSIAMPLRSRTAGGKTLDSFRDISEPLLRVFQTLSLQAAYKPISDIVVGNTKVSGCSQARRAGALLQHGTILLDVEKKKIARYLKVDSEKAWNIGGLKDFLGEVVKTEEFVRDMVAEMILSFQAAWGFDVCYDAFSDAEMEQAYKIEEHFFANTDWNENRVSRQSAAG